MRSFLIAIALMCSACNQSGIVLQEESPVSELRGPYLGQTLPGSTPEIFAPGIVSTGLATRDIAMTPDGKELYFGAFVGGKAVIMESHQIDDVWSDAVVAPFSGVFMDLEPNISPDGLKFFFLSTRPQAGQEAKDGWAYQDIWIMNRENNGWGEPFNPGLPINTEAGEYFPSVTINGTIYFTREGENGISSTWRSQFVDGAYTEPEMLGPDFNIGDNRFNVFVAPDESFAIVPATGIEGAHSQADYWIIFQNDDGTWSKPVNLGEKINLKKGRGYSASFSPDGAYLFFMSSKSVEQDPVVLTGLKMKELIETSAHPGSGNSSIWWVDAAFLKDLRPE